MWAQPYTIYHTIFLCWLTIVVITSKIFIKITKNINVDFFIKSWYRSKQIVYNSVILPNVSLAWQQIICLIAGASPIVPFALLMQSERPFLIFRTLFIWRTVKTWYHNMAQPAIEKGIKNENQWMYESDFAASSWRETSFMSR